MTEHVFGFRAHLGDIDLFVASDDRSFGLLFCDPKGSLILPDDIPSLIEMLQIMQFYMQVRKPAVRSGEDPAAPAGEKPDLNTL